MFLEHNQVIDKLKQNQPVYYSTLCSGSPAMAELMGYIGVDYVRIDMEHHPLDINELTHCVRALQLSKTIPVVRIPEHSEGTIHRILETGVMGIQAPHVDTGEDARRLVKSIHFAPEGNRGFSDGSRAGCYGMLSKEDYIRYSERNVFLIAQIESRKGVENIEEIVASGVDIITQGPHDLSVDMGFGGRKTPEVAEAIAHIHEVCRKAGVPFVAYNFKNTEESYRECYEEGARVFSIGGDMSFLRNGLKRLLGNVCEWQSKM